MVVDSVGAVVGARVVVVAEPFLSLEQAAAVSSAADSTTRTVRRRRISVMAAQSSQWAPMGAVKLGNLPARWSVF